MARLVASTFRLKDDPPGEDATALLDAPIALAMAGRATVPREAAPARLPA